MPRNCARPHSCAHAHVNLFQSQPSAPTAPLSGVAGAAGQRLPGAHRRGVLAAAREALHWGQLPPGARPEGWDGRVTERFVHALDGAWPGAGPAPPALRHGSVKDLSATCGAVATVRRPRGPSPASSPTHKPRRATRFPAPPRGPGRGTCNAWARVERLRSPGRSVGRPGRVTSGRGDGAAAHARAASGGPFPQGSRTAASHDSSGAPRPCPRKRSRT